MKHHTNRAKKYSALTAALMTALYLGLSAPLLAAESPMANKKVPDPNAQPPAASVRAQVAQKCMSELQAFDGKMQKDGYWMGEAGAGYGYPMASYAGERGGLMPLGGANVAAGEHAIDRKEGATGPTAAPNTEASARYWRARPGYEIRTLVIAANILARRGQQKECEAVLATTRDIYTTYKTELNSNGVPKANMSLRQREQITSAQPVTAHDASFRSDQLIGTSVVSQQNKDLGSISDIIMSPKTGKIAYLVIGRGGVFGINEKYVPVPWNDFKFAADSNLLVLDTNKSTMDGAPRVEQGQFSKHRNFSEESKKIDAYWKAPQS
ncbi:MAG: PRC-barrel domain-containing protein [Paralcaligenes sp.]